MRHKVPVSLRAATTIGMAAMIALSVGACARKGQDKAYRTGLQSLNPGMFPKRAPAMSYAQCLARIREAGAVFRPVPNRTERRFCSIEGAVEVSAIAGVRLSKPLILTCPMVHRLDSWLRRDVQPAARRHLGARVERLWVFGSYSCRLARGRRWGGKWSRLSQHAIANAIDIAGMWTQGGRQIRVKRDWRRRGARGRFLRSIANRSCNVFSVALTPDYDRQHHNHFHLDAARHRLCGYRGRFGRRYVRR